ncbi:MAG: hypothetical protein BWZ07_00559 [Alphaproteobacteria bacterium ADurb.BinA280]|nr:MAG: hypothetical protein BWZ07_00559 [Alphaproteobacteria bacterium ADurb.BinA280]
MNLASSTVDSTVATAMWYEGVSVPSREIARCRATEPLTGTLVPHAGTPAAVRKI